jgi:DNA-binding CsgD family transcriptional regulator
VHSKTIAKPDEINEPNYSLEKVTGQKPARAARSLVLSPRQLEIVRHLGTGATDREIAEALRISVRTVGNTLHRLYDKTGVSSRTHLAMLHTQGALTERPNGRAPRRPATDRPEP